LVFEDAIQVRGQKENRVHKHELIKEKLDKIGSLGIAGV